MSRSITLFLLSLALLSLSAPAGATVIYVSGDQTGTWAADTVIVTAEVRVPPGQSLTISPGVEVLFSVYCKLIVDNGATLLAVGTPADSIRFDVLPPDTAWHGVRFLSASDSSRLEYCHLTNGSATGGGEDNKGGAIYCTSSSPTIQNCLFDDCDAAGSGGAICCVNSSPSISSNTISGNSATLGNGGGINCELSSPIISGNTISENSASFYGGGIYCNNSSPIISDNAISGNSAGAGGAIECADNSNPIITGNTLSTNSAITSGGGIYCNNSSPSISGNTISENSAGIYGGGIFCYGSSPTICGNTIGGNSAIYGGGISCYNNSSSIISGNIISGNSVSSSGGGIFCDYNSSPIINGNTISDNTAGDYGGGIACDDNSSPSIGDNAISGNSASFGGGIQCSDNSNPTISDNIISSNGLSTGGGGIYCYTSSPTIRGNTISGNSALWGGGIGCEENPSAIIISNTIVGNSATYGGGLGCPGATSPTLVNCILWNNALPQIYGGAPQVSYSDIQGGYAGTGNIAIYPAFVDTAQGDYRLQWGSPCIDTGDPNIIYNDPDGSRADMGAWYYDQSLPVRILLTPYNAPIQIPASGGSFDYAIQATNIESTTLPLLVWCDVTLPSGTIYGPVLGPVTIPLAAGQTLSRVRTQTVPAGAPAGMYYYNAYAVAAGDTSEDSFVFTKLGSGIRDSGFGGWANAGEEFESSSPKTESAALRTYNLELRISPNPFNPSTALSYQLSANSHVSLKVYDTAGRLMETLVDGWRDAGAYEATVDGSNLPSGIYFAKLTAGEFNAVQKMVLLK